MQKIIILLLIFTISKIYSQGIGEIIPDKEPIKFPKNAIGFDLMFSEGGIGAGGFYRKVITEDFSFFTDLSFSEAKDEKEIEYIDPYDPYGRVYVLGKKNRIFLIPINIGMHYRLFRQSITDNLRPYINVGAGPSFVITTPYEREFFNAFGHATNYITAGGYVGLGANFGINQKHLIGVNIRYLVVHFFNKGVEGLQDRFKKNLGGIYITINIGTMY